MEWIEAMLTRRSVRTYTGEALAAKTLERVVESFDRSARLGALPMRLAVMDAAEAEPAMTGLVGSYGAMKDAPHYLIGIVASGDRDQIHFGFAMEQTVLECWRMGLGTCWIGGFFKKTEMHRRANLSKDERVVCVSPVGKAAPRRFAERSMRSLGGLNVRKPIEERVFDGAWGEPAVSRLKTDSDLVKVFECARWAPSASNKQPCHYVLDGGAVVLCLDTSLRGRYAKLLAGDRAEGLDFQGVDAGIGMAHVFLAARELGRPGKWSLDFDEAAFRERLRLPETVRPEGVFRLSEA